MPNPGTGVRAKHEQRAISISSQKFRTQFFQVTFKYAIGSTSEHASSGLASCQMLAPFILERADLVIAGRLGSVDRLDETRHWSIQPLTALATHAAISVISAVCHPSPIGALGIVPPSSQSVLPLGVAFLHLSHLDSELIASSLPSSATILHLDLLTILSPLNAILAGHPIDSYRAFLSSWRRGTRIHTSLTTQLTIFPTKGISLTVLQDPLRFLRFRERDHALNLLEYRHSQRLVLTI